MRILANENIPHEVISLLQARGHDIVWIRTESPGETDDAILVRAKSEERLLITFDKDFGELVFRKGLDVSCGIVLFRMTLPSPAEAATKIVAVLESRSDWTGHFSVVEDRRIRMVPLPSGPPRRPK